MMRRLAFRISKRVAPFFDAGFWALTLISLVPLWFLDRPMVLTLLQWCAFFLALAGIAIVVSRVLLPQVDLSDWLMKVARESRNTGAGLVVLGVCVLLSSVLLSMVLWAKA